MVGEVYPVYMPGYPWWVYQPPYHAHTMPPWVHRAPTRRSSVRTWCQCSASVSRGKALGSVLRLIWDMRRTEVSLLLRC